MVNMDTKNFETVEEVAEVAVGETKKMESSPETESNDTDVEVAVNDVLTGIEEVDKDIRRLQERQLELLELLDPDSLASYRKATGHSNITVSKKKAFKKKKAKRRMAKKSKK
jgi:hypothetical protein